MKTPLYHRHAESGARIVPFAGWEMPVQYEGIIQEHHWTREQASIFDTCHMGEFEVRGPEALSGLENLLTQSVATIAEGQCRYGYLLNDEGGVLDDLMCYRRAEDHFFLVVNAGTLEKDREWMVSHLSKSTVFTDLSDITAKIDVQGPRSREIIEGILGTDLPELKYFRFADAEIAGIACTISRTGYTGEWGYEFYFPSENAVELWDLFTSTGKVKPAGLGARDTLRLESGYALYGHELNSTQTPVSAGRGMFIRREKEFIGKEAVVKDLDEGCSRYLAGLTLGTKRAARAHDRVLLDGKEVGEVTSGSLSPSLGSAVAMAYVDSELTEPGTSLSVEVRNTPLDAIVTELPFYKDGSARG